MGSWLLGEGESVLKEVVFSRIRGCLELCFTEVDLEMIFMQAVCRQCSGQTNERVEKGKAKHGWFIEFQNHFQLDTKGSSEHFTLGYSLLPVGKLGGSLSVL